MCNIIGEVPTHCKVPIETSTLIFRNNTFIESLTVLRVTMTIWYDQV